MPNNWTNEKKAEWLEEVALLGCKIHNKIEEARNHCGNAFTISKAEDQLESAVLMCASAVTAEGRTFDFWQALDVQVQGLRAECTKHNKKGKFCSNCGRKN